jgi:nicotinamide-nucleotide amidase
MESLWYKLDMGKMPELEIGTLLRRSGLKLATAESCTGGLVADRITNIAGSSDYFLGGVVAYDNRVKHAVLGVPAETLENHGAVSEATVRAMAEGTRRLLGADLAVSLSGVAGPGGGSVEKPVGTTWIGLAAPDGTWARVFLFKGQRVENKAFSASAALEFVLEYLQGGRLLDGDLRGMASQRHESLLESLIRKIRSL